MSFDLNIPLGEVLANSGEKTKRPLLIRIDNTDDFILQIDNTTMSYFHTCPRSSFFYTVRRKQRPDRAPLIFGGAIHEALEVLYRDGFEFIEKAILHALNYFEAHPYNSTGQWRNPAYAVEAIRRYVDHWDLMDNLKPISSSWVEKPFALNVGCVEVNAKLPYSASQLTDETSDEPLYVATIHVQWTGKIDIGATNGDDRIWVVDHKTTSMGGDTFYADFELGQQTHGYKWAMDTILGQKTSGFILNALLIRQPTRTGKGMEFDRKSYIYSDESITEWRTDMMQSVENYIHALTNDAFPKHTAWCMGKYGRCQYHTVCTLPLLQRRFILNSTEFENVNWSPLKHE